MPRCIYCKYSAICSSTFRRSAPKKFFGSNTRANCRLQSQKKTSHIRCFRASFTSLKMCCADWVKREENSLPSTHNVQLTETGKHIYVYIVFCVCDDAHCIPHRNRIDAMLCATDDVENQFTFFFRRDRKHWRQSSWLISMFYVCVCVCVICW